MVWVEFSWVVGGDVARCWYGRDFCRWSGFDEFGVAVPFSAAGVATPTILASATVSPLEWLAWEYRVHDV